MHNISKKTFIEYWIYMVWSFITVTSFPFIIGSSIHVTDHRLLPLYFTAVSWIALIVILIVKYRDRENPLYHLLRKHALIGGVVQAITSFPAYFSMTINASGSASDDSIFYWAISSIIASFGMAIYDFYVMKNMMEYYTGKNLVPREFLIMMYFISVALVMVFFFAVTDATIAGFFDELGWVFFASAIFGLHLTVLMDAMFALYQSIKAAPVEHADDHPEVAQVQEA